MEGAVEAFCEKNIYCFIKIIFMQNNNRNIRKINLQELMDDKCGLECMLCIVVLTFFFIFLIVHTINNFYVFFFSISFHTM